MEGRTMDNIERLVSLLEQHRAERDWFGPEGAGRMLDDLYEKYRDATLQDKQERARLLDFLQESVTRFRSEKETKLDSILNNARQALSERTTPRDLDIVLSLLTEYTRELRRAFEGRSRVLIASSQYAVLTGLSVTFCLVSFLAYWNGSLDQTTGSALAGGGFIVGAFASVAFGSAALLARRAAHQRFMLDRLAGKVEELIAVASQYYEHANARLGDAFSFKLRLAEAEEALEAYRGNAGKGVAVER
jgi:hypothetical protein